MSHIWRIALILLIIATIIVPAPGRVMAQDDSLDRAQAIFQNMSIAERVGQLFIVTFPGDGLQRNDAVGDLLIHYKIGGVVLLAANDNITGRDGGVPQQVARLSNTLQRAALLGDAAFITDTVSFDEAGTPVAVPTPQPVSPGIPLFIATSQEGDGAPNSNLRAGLTELPSAMAIGATWDPRLAEDMGRLAGRELSALGVNMLLGPSLDVLETPDPTSSSDLGTRSFGGSPYWVGQLGQAYIAGVHQGSEGRIAVVAKHFPGQGSSDRPLGEEVSTVQKDLEGLQRVELAPFFAVTGGASTAASTVDALLTTHIRYQGFQGNIRPTTPPVSFDPQALAALLGLAPLDAWRREGGVLVSDALGVPAVQRFYDDTGQEFPHRRVAKDALLAGNDLLYLGDFAQEPSGFDAQIANIRDTITWFQEKYITDPAFQQRVDDAVLRILRLKLELHGDDFSLDNVLVDQERQPALAASREADVLQVAQEAITLLAPSAPELAERLPSPPGAGDQIVIFTDVRQSRQCRDCPLQPYIGETSLQERILALYGPQASNQIQEEQIASFSFSDLEEFLAAGPGPILPPTPVPTVLPELGETPEAADADETPVPQPPPVAYQVQGALDEAEWVIFAMLDVTPDIPASNALKRLLAERPDVVRDSRIVVFAYGAPYYLDTTEVSKLAAYYGVYSKSDAFIDTSVRALFQETTLAGAPPVDVPSVNYNLQEVTQPDPNQIIELFVMRDGQPQAPPSEEPLELVVGDTLRLQTGVITDRNQRPVPDGTLVQFIRQDRLEGFISVIGERPTTNGIATLDYVLERRIGQFRITAAAGNATASHQIDIAIDEKASIVAITPTPAPTPTPTLTPTPTTTPTVPASRTPRATPTAVAVTLPDEPHLEIGLADFQQLLGLLAGLLLIGGAGWTASGNGHRNDLTARVRLLAWGLMAALLLYNYFALDLPGSGLLDPVGSWAGLLAALAGGVFGLLLGWWQLEHPDASRAS